MCVFFPNLQNHTQICMNMQNVLFLILIPLFNEMSYIKAFTVVIKLSLETGEYLNIASSLVNLKNDLETIQSEACIERLISKFSFGTIYLKVYLSVPTHLSVEFLSAIL